MGKKGRFNVYERIYDPHDDTGALNDEFCGKCSHNRVTPACAISRHAAFVKERG